jgi:hypothetical protein
MPCSWRMRNCKASCLHRALVHAFYLEQAHWEQQVEAAAGDYETERQEFVAENPQPTFKEHLIQATRGDSSLADERKSA